MLSINTNLPALIAQNSLKNSTLKLNTAIERMTTGFKINSAKDNAANYSIVTNMSTKINAYQVAEDNVAMGLDLLSTVNGSLDLIGDKLARLKALAEQAANGTYGEQSLKAINNEARTLVDEISRVNNNTEFNGQKLFAKSSQFINDIQERDTSAMTTLESVDINTAISSGTYSISTADELAKLAAMANNGLINGGEFVLANDIDLQEWCEVHKDTNGWVPIGNSAANAFNGTFDGNGHVISNLKIFDRKSDVLGLFGSFNGTLKNLGVENIDINIGEQHGGVGLIGYNAGDTADIIIENCYITGKITAGHTVGGMIGGSVANSLVIDSCYSNLTMIGTGAHFGGLVGNNYSLNTTITNSFSKGSIKGKITRAGGLIGSNCGAPENRQTTMTDCYSSMDVTGETVIGGICGSIMGNNSITFKNTYSTGNITSTADINNGLGGFIGSIATDYTGEVLLENCYTTGYIKGPSGNSYKHFRSGFIGYAKNATLKNCYSLGSGENIGGSIFGYEYSNSCKIENCYYSPFYDEHKIKIASYDSTANKFKDKVSSYDGRAPFSFTDKFVNLQVGIYGDDSSQIGFTTTFNLDNLYNLYGIGIRNDNYLSTIDNINAEITAKQTEFGAVQNRLESALEEIGTQYENLVSSRSTLRDADISEVSSEYIKQQILQQASATLLATANQSPALALQLI